MLDLHMHSMHSEDGELAPGELVRRCVEAGVDFMSVTDHNSMHGVEAAAAAAETAGLAFLNGVELNCVYKGLNFHVLGYGVSNAGGDFTQVDADMDRKYLETGQIEQVLCDGENYDGARSCHFDWVRSLRQECVDNNVTFVFCGTGRRFVKDGRLYKIEGNGLQSQHAYKSGMSFKGKPIHFNLYNDMGYPLFDEDRYKPTFRERCETCGMRLSCNGCSNCGKCEK